MYRSGMIREADDVCLCYLSSQQWFWIDKIRTTKFTWPKLIVKLMKLRRRTHFWQWAETYLRAFKTWKIWFFVIFLFYFSLFLVTKGQTVCEIYYFIKIYEKSSKTWFTSLSLWCVHFPSLIFFFAEIQRNSSLWHFFHKLKSALC